MKAVKLITTQRFFIFLFSMVAAAIATPSYSSIIVVSDTADGILKQDDSPFHLDFPRRRRNLEPHRIR